ncbi:DUF4240 domain-containing protein [Sphingomonas sp. So64.6b]|uniref:DUF4240 domain-containing protein n=1 Tax=Sphingomonas sp. So64.6b TaxID=2997354 RepID=UPI0016049C52|nr:DUF4240 domain-containing protein [Sphingomonas sp. So64.6b]QNA86192.1 DUF4240 domain-containing protein [Sphingomonas sp. So64.6b]
MKVFATCFALILTVAILTLGFANGAKAKTRAPETPPAAIVIDAGPLSKAGFWALIDHSAAFEADPPAQLADLRASLAHLTPAQIVDFERHFDETMRQSYSWDLWGAAYLSNGGASDDGFEYFRCWLISKGRAAFEDVSARPDALADILAPGVGNGDIEFEALAYVAREIWAAKTGRDWNEMPVIANMAYDAEPAGARFSESPAELARRYPNLWKRFGR